MRRRKGILPLPAGLHRKVPSGSQATLVGHIQSETSFHVPLFGRVILSKMSAVPWEKRQPDLKSFRQLSGGSQGVNELPAVSLEAMKIHQRQSRKPSACSSGDSAHCKAQHCQVPKPPGSNPGRKHSFPKVFMIIVHVCFCCLVTEERELPSLCDFWMIEHGSASKELKDKLEDIPRNFFIF